MIESRLMIELRLVVVRLRRLAVSWYVGCRL